MKQSGLGLQPQQNPQDILRLLDEADAYEQQQVQQPSQPSPQEILRLLDEADANYAQPQQQPASSLGQDISSLWEGAKQVPGAVVKGIEGLGEHPGQAAAGVIPGLASVIDIPAFALNMANQIPEYLKEKVTGNKVSEKEAYKPFEYHGSKLGTILADIIAGEPKTELEKAGRGFGEIGSSLLTTPAGVAKTVKIAGELPGIKQGVNAVKTAAKAPVKAINYIKEKLPSLPEKSAKNALIENMQDITPRVLQEGEVPEFIGRKAEEAVKTKELAAKKNIKLSPAEATGDPLLLAMEESGGTTKKGAKKQIAKYNADIVDQEVLINEALNSVHPESKIVNDEIRTLAQKIVEKPVLIREKAASPVYKQAYKDTVGEIVPTKAAQSLDKTVTELIKEQYPDLPEKILTKMKEKAFPTLDDMTPENIEDIFGKQTYNRLKGEGYFDEAKKTEVKWPKEITDSKNIMEAIRIAKKDVPYADELKNFAPNSVKVLDVAKQVIDSKIEQALKNKDGSLARAWQISKDKLLNVTDEYSPTYKDARQIFEKHSPAVVAMEKSKIGKIANMSDEQTKNISKEIFDPTVTDPKTFAKYRDEITKISPDAWASLTRQEMERILQKGENTGKNFHTSLLKDNNMFNKFQQALKGNPKAHENFNIMKRIFANLKNEPKVKKSAAGIPVPKMSIGEVPVEMVRKFIASSYDEPLVALTTGTKWDKELRLIDKAPKSEQLKRLGELLEKIGGKVAKTKAPIPRSAIALDKILKNKPNPKEDEAFDRVLSNEPAEDDEDEYIPTIDLYEKKVK